jgi:hypothetical protein
MSVVVKISLPGCRGAPPQWIGEPDPADLSKCVVPRDEARVFLTPAEAESEIERFQQLLPTHAFLFEIENT